MSDLKHKILFRPIEISHHDLPYLISLSIGMPTEKKIQHVLTSYTTANHHLIGAFSGNILIGVIGIEITGKTCAIKHLAVAPPHRMKNLGKQLIMYVTHHFSLQHFTAETDDDAIGFYKKCGFQCKSFENQYGRRFFCVLDTIA